MMPARPFRSESIYARWQPGQGYQGRPGVTGLYLGFAGLGQSGETVDEGGSLPGSNLDFSSGEVDPSTLFAPTTGGASIDDYTTAWEGESGITNATPEQQAAAQAWLLQNVPVTAQSPSALSTLALTAAQIATGLTAGTVKASAACPSGYSYSTGVCVPKSGSSPAGQWFPFATNNQVMTFGFVVIGALVIVNLIPSGGGRRRR